jgi:uncharacterized protein YbjT (DUF2867 family)
MDERPILVTGATGYVGGRLVPRLLAAGYCVRAMGRSLEKLSGRHWAAHPNLELAEADVLDEKALAEAVRGSQAVYYLVHSMNPGTQDFADADRRAARLMARLCSEAGVERIIYLGGLGENQPNLSPHLRSRAEVAEIFRAGPVPATILRAAMIIGSGSASFEMLRYLVERLPLMVTPRWVHTRSQPIAIRNVLHYLVACLDVPETAGRSFDIGGESVVTYADLMNLYAEAAGLTRPKVLPVPVFSPRLSSYWVHLITPVPASLARPLAEGMKTTVVCEDHAIRALIPQPLLHPGEAIRLALQRLEEGAVETHWSDAGWLPDPELCDPGDPSWAGGTVYQDQRMLLMRASEEELWQPIVRIGGETGWYYGNWLWWLRGMLDLLFGGVGPRQTRRDPSQLAIGDALDFWRVLSVEPPYRLQLLAEMKVPGQATLTFELRPGTEPGTTWLIQTARFRPRGILGLLYWWAVTPLHHFVFNGMLAGIGRACGKPALGKVQPVRFRSSVVS